MKKRIPKIDGRPQLWYDYYANSLEIRYMKIGRGHYKAELFYVSCCFGVPSKWMTVRWSLMPEDLIEAGYEFLGYL